MNHTERILVVDDEKTICTVVAEALESHGYQVQTAANATEALRACEQIALDLALVDLKVPGSMDGMGLLTEIRRRWPQTVVIMMTGYGSLDSAIAALREGAFDYITKPASVAQIVESTERGLAKRREELHHQHLIAHLEDTLRELRRESQAGATQPEVINRFAQTSNLLIDRQKRLVVHDGTPLELTSTEFDLLDYLARNADRVVTASELVKAIQGYDLAEVDARPIVRVHIQRLRQKLEDDPENPRFVLNVRGRGYRFVG